MQIETPIDAAEQVEQPEPSHFRPSADLDVDLFSDVIRALRPVNRFDQSEQRRQPRAGLAARANIIPLVESNHPSSLAILVRNISSGGIGFLYEHKLNLDEQFALLLPREGDSPAIVLCEVVCWQPVAQGVYAIGARFIRVLRDGGNIPLPITINAPADSIILDIGRVTRKAS